MAISTCERHGIKLEDHTLICGAPVCCPECCKEANLEQKIHLLEVENRKLLDLIVEAEKAIDWMAHSSAYASLGRMEPEYDKICELHSRIKVIVL